MRWFLKFCKGMGIEDPCLPTKLQDERNFFMAMYAVFLTGGETLLCRSIKADTIRRYLNNAAELCKPRRLMSPLITCEGRPSDWVESIIKEHKRWEKMPDRQEPVTSDMLDYVIAWG